MTFGDTASHIRLFAGGAVNRLFTQKSGFTDLLPFRSKLALPYSFALAHC